MRIEPIPQVDLDGVGGITMAPLNAGTSAERVKIDIAILQPGSSLPKHLAGREQVFCVVAGKWSCRWRRRHRAPDRSRLGRGIRPRRAAYVVGRLADDGTDHAAAPRRKLDRAPGDQGITQCRTDTANRCLRGLARRRPRNTIPVTVGRSRCGDGAILAVTRGERARSSSQGVPLASVGLSGQLLRTRGDGRRASRNGIQLR